MGGTLGVPVLLPSSTLGVSGAATMSSTLAVTGDSNLSNVNISGTTIVSGDIVPNTADSVSLGSASKPFAGLYISNNTIHFAGSDANNSAAMSFADGELGVSSNNTTQTFLAAVNNQVGIVTKHQC